MKKTMEILDVDNNLTVDINLLTKPDQNRDSLADIGFPEFGAVESIPLPGINDGIMEDWLYGLCIMEREINSTA